MRHTVLCLVTFVMFAESACGTPAEVFDAGHVDGTDASTDAALNDANSVDSVLADTNTVVDGNVADHNTSTDHRIDDAGVGADLRVDAHSDDLRSNFDAHIQGPDAGVQGVELNPGWIGGACENAGDCDEIPSSAMCETSGFENGLCTQACTAGASGAYVCPDTDYSDATLNTVTRCIEDDQGEPRCVGECDFAKSPTGCRPGYSCVLQQRFNQPSRIFPVCLPSSTQTWPGAATANNDIGDACNDATECGHLTCLGLSGGYCTKSMCEFTGCPSGSSCYEISSLNVTACLKDCDNSSQCRQDDGYECAADVDVCWPQPASGCQIPDEAGFNHYTIAAINDDLLFPKDSSYPFCWLSSSCGDSWGLIHDGWYAGQRAFGGGGDCFCTGHTLEIFLDAWRRYRQDHNLADNAIFGGLTYNELHLGMFYQHWQGSGSAPYASSATAFASVGIGEVLGQSQWEQVRAGDYINLSRDPPSGHAVIFISWVRDSSNQIIGLRYYGCNPGGSETCPDASDPENRGGQTGPGFITEYLYGHGGEVLPQYLFIGRVHEP